MVNGVGKKPKILVIGGTGRFGKHVVDASIRANHATFVFTRPPATDDTEKKKILESFTSLGVELIFGTLHDYEMLLEAVKKVDVIISTLGSDPVQLELQTKIIKAIMEAGNIKRFIPSEFGMDPERVNPVEPAKAVFMMKAQIRQMIKNYNMPHTIIRSHIFQNFYIPRLGQAEISPPIYDTVGIIGDGNAQVLYVNARDIATYVIKTVDDPRTLNKILYITPRSPPPLSFQLSIAYSAYINGVQPNFNIDPSSAVEATELYPEVGYITVEEFMDSLL
ncbi:hypothetical protein LUZ63_013731 [Rhynchospora breviuscula]|uniref:NmrA-like domain-containing protein n=1 Tax=Rhynchospora breviuscula TaxID=2022672 RepID=A0A9Q0HKH5_9POAL|nr:hypothetical protein LUZ63_013731 [Rhynchospora breviuscula]